MSIKLIGDRVLVKDLGPQEENISGLIVGRNDTERARKGNVIAVGPGIDGHEMIIKKDDIVLYGKNSGIELIVDNEYVFIMRECDIYSVIEE